MNKKSTNHCDDCEPITLVSNSEKIRQFQKSFSKSSEIKKSFYLFLDKDKITSKVVKFILQMFLGIIFCAVSSVIIVGFFFGLGIFFSWLFASTNVGIYVGRFIAIVFIGIMIVFFIISFYKIGSEILKEMNR